MAGDKAKLLPFYLVVDVSASMMGASLDAANSMLPEVVEALARNPILGDKVRFGLIDFSDEAREVLPLCDLLDPNVALPTLATRDGTSYAAAFRLLRQRIEQTMSQLKADGYLVRRPVVFFLSDGNPTDTDAEWQSAFDDLTRFDHRTKTGFSMYPNFIPFGVGDADPIVMRDLIHPASGAKPMRMFLMEEGNSVAKAIGAMSEILISSVIGSAMSLAQGASGVILPDPNELPAGITVFSASDEDFM